MKKYTMYQIVVLTIYIVLVLVFLIFSLQSGSSSSGLSSSITNVFCNIFNIENNKDIVEKIIRKLIGHFGYFLLMGIFSSLFLYSLKNTRFLYLFIINLSINLVVAFISEFLCQAIASNRCPSIIDVLIDYSGFMISCSIITFIYLKHRKIYFSK